VVTGANPADLVYGTPLGSAQLNATASVSGSFAYTPPAGTVLAAGPNQPLAVTFTPADTDTYTTVTVAVTINVTRAPLTVKADDRSRPYGAANPPLTGALIGVVNNNAITVSYSTTATPASPIGAYPIVPSLADPGGKLVNYTVTATNGSLTVGKAPLTVRLMTRRSSTATRCRRSQARSPESRTATPSPRPTRPRRRWGASRAYTPSRQTWLTRTANLATMR
jgi:hypothetical protein